MSEIAYCYTCNRGQPVETLPQRHGWRICAVCKNDELGETVDPALTGGRVPVVPPVKYVTATETEPVRVPELAHCNACKTSRPITLTSTLYRVCSVCGTDDVAPQGYTGPRPAKRAEPRPYTMIAAEVAATVERKQAAYGGSFGKSGAIMAILYPAGVPVEQLDDALTIVRVLDKLFRVATDRDALEENPWGDIAGYALLAVRRVEQDKGRA